MPTKPAPVIAKVRVQYWLCALVLYAVSISVGLGVKWESPKVTPVVGISVFAVLYVLSQGIERLTEIILPFLDLLLGRSHSAKKRKREAIQMTNLIRRSNLLAAAGLLADDPAVPAVPTTPAAAKDAANEADHATTELQVISLALGFSVAFVFVSYFGYSIFNAIGYTGAARWVDLLFTAAAIAGGSAGLHELIGKLQKSKDADETAAA